MLPTWQRAASESGSNTPGCWESWPHLFRFQSVESLRLTGSRVSLCSTRVYLGGLGAQILQQGPSETMVLARSCMVPDSQQQTSLCTRHMLAWCRAFCLLPPLPLESGVATHSFSSGHGQAVERMALSCVVQASIICLTKRFKFQTFQSASNNMD